MPSIPQSLLWISLVVLWLFVLVPMLISKRETVRRTSDVALATRVLNTGRAGRLLRRRGPAAGHHSDPHWQPSDEEVDDLDGGFEGDDSVTKPRKTVVLAASATATEPDYLDVDVVEMDSGALPVGATQPKADDPQLPLDFGAEAAAEQSDERWIDEAEPVREPAPEPAFEAGPQTAAIRTVDEADFDEDAEPVGEPAAVAPEPATQDDDMADDAADGTEHDYEYVDDSSGLEAPSETDTASRRTRFESKTAVAVRERKFAFRKRMLLALAVLLIGTGAAGYFVSSTLWWATGVLGAFTVLYLAYLRRQTRIEEQLRRRRAHRMARSRLGVENTNDQEFDVVPSRLARPGSVVLEIDDEDPIFEHLDEVAFARSYDLPRASGQ
jgi:uncharacterized membrane protein